MAQHRIRIHVITRKGVATKSSLQGFAKEASQIYAPIGVEFVFDPQVDVEEIDEPILLAKNPSGWQERASLYRGKLVIYIREDPGLSAESSQNHEYVAMLNKADQIGQRLLAHEIGHYFWLSHTYTWGHTTNGNHYKLDKVIQAVATAIETDPDARDIRINPKTGEEIDEGRKPPFPPRSSGGATMS